MPDTAGMSFNGKRTITIKLDASLNGWPSLPYLQDIAGDAVLLREGAHPQVTFFGPYARPGFLTTMWRRLGHQSRSGLRVFWCGENRDPDFAQFDWCFTLRDDDVVRHERHCRLPVGQPGLSHIQVPRPTPRRFCNFVYSNPVSLREAFCRRLSLYKPVDCPGSRLNNMPPIGSHTSPAQSRFAPSWDAEKRAFLATYKFTIAFENSAGPGYTTEKLTDPMLANSIPIYWGNPLVARDFNPKSFVLVRDESDFDSAIERVIALDQDETSYEAMLAAPKQVEGREYENQRQALREGFARLLATVDG